MRAYWITFDDGTSACCEGSSPDDATLIASKLTGKGVVDRKPLPYPAAPCVWQFDHPVRGKHPIFCYTPNACAGRTSCAGESCVD